MNMSTEVSIRHTFYIQRNQFMSQTFTPLVLASRPYDFFYTVCTVPVHEWISSKSLK